VAGLAADAAGYSWLAKSLARNGALDASRDVFRTEIESHQGREVVR